jgi:hypothetical protein
MANLPVFPEFKPLELADREIIHSLLWGYQPETSELTFTNLFIWRSHYGFTWSLEGDWLLVAARAPQHGGWAFPPVGSAPRVEISRKLLGWLRERGEADPRLERVDQRLAAELAGAPGFFQEPVRDHFDYVYRAEDLIHLTGGEYHAKRNHLSAFKRSYVYSYEPFQDKHLSLCLRMADQWCQMRRCKEDLSLMGEWEAVGEALKNFAALELQGGVILVNDKVEAFSLGERLNRETAVIHIEKANPELRGLYAVINQHFCENAWAQVPFINREQDLGEPGLRVAKLSYHPSHLAEKFRVRIKD